MNKVIKKPSNRLRSSPGILQNFPNYLPNELSRNCFVSFGIPNLIVAILFSIYLIA